MSTQSIESIMIGGASTPPKSTLATIFSIDTLEKDTLFNLVQYVTISIIPLIIVLRGLKEYIPEEDDTKSSIEIIAEILIEIVIIVFSIWFINKVITHIPTYSQRDYPEMSLFPGMLPLIFILMTLQSKFSNKINILFDRAYNPQDGKMNGKNDTRPSQNNSRQPRESPGTSLQMNNQMPPPPPHQPMNENNSDKFQEPNNFMMDEPMAANGIGMDGFSQW